MSYAGNKGSMIAKPAMMRGAHWPKIGTSPIATLHDPKTGDQYFMGFNHPADIPGCKLLVDFSEKSTTLYNKAEDSDGNWAGTSINTALYEDGIFGAYYNPVFGADYFSAPNNNVLDDGTFTIEAICKFHDITSSANNRIISKAEGSGWAFGAGLDGVQGGVSFYYHDGATYQKIWIDEEYLDTTSWWHVAATVTEGEAASIYLNGRLMNTVAVGTYTHCAGYPAIILAECGGPLTRTFDGDCAAIRYCDRVLKPHEFMNHWYFNTLVDGDIVSGGAVLFDEAVSAFEPDTVFTVQADWDSTYEMKTSNIIVNNYRGIPDDNFNPSMNDFTRLMAGGNPLIDDKTIACWVFDGRLNELGQVPDLVSDAHLDLDNIGPEDIKPTRIGEFYHGTGVHQECFTLSVEKSKRFRVQEYTIEALVITDTAASYHGVFTYDYTTHQQPYYGIHMRIDASGKLGNLWNNGSVVDAIYSPSGSVVDGRLHHVAITFRSGKQRTFVDGVEFGTESNVATISFWDTKVYIGGFRNFESTTLGSNLFVRFSNVERTADEILRNAEALSRLDGRMQDLFLPS